MFVVLGIVAALVLALGVFIALTWAPERSVEELKARWAPPPSVFLDVAGMQVHLRDEGPRDDPTPVVLLHGGGSSLHAWEGWTQALKIQRRVIRFDLPGFGLTGPSPDGRYGGDNAVRFVIAVLDKLGVTRCVIGGNSMGVRSRCAPRSRIPPASTSSSWSTPAAIRSAAARPRSDFG